MELAIHQPVIPVYQGKKLASHLSKHLPSNAEGRGFKPHRGSRCIGIIHVHVHVVVLSLWCPYHLKHHDVLVYMFALSFSSV